MNRAEKRRQEKLSAKQAKAAKRSRLAGADPQAINQAVEANFSNLMRMFTAYMGSWVNNGTPYEIRFYNSGTFRDLRSLRNKLKADKNFGGDFEIVSANNYTKLICTLYHAILHLIIKSQKL